MRIKSKTRKRRGGIAIAGIGRSGIGVMPTAIGGAIRMVSDTVGGLIKGTGDGIANMMGSKPDVKSSANVPDVIPSQLDSTKSKAQDQKGGKRKRRKCKHTTRPSLYQIIRTTMNRIRRNRTRVRPNNVARGHGKSKKRRKRNITKRKKKKRRKRKK
jgi:hypothetical protein